MKTPRHFSQTKKEQRNKRSNPDGGEQRPAITPEDSNLTDEGNLTTEDLEALGPVDLSMDMGDDEQLKHREQPVDFSGDDLDIPGAELDDASEETGSEDEENNNYSTGDDNNK